MKQNENVSWADVVRTQKPKQMATIANGKNVSRGCNSFSRNNPVNRKEVLVDSFAVLNTLHSPTQHLQYVVQDHSTLAGE